MAADREQDIQFTADHMEFRRPEGLLKTALWTERKDQVLRDSLREEPFDGFGFPDIKADIIQVVMVEM